MALTDCRSCGAPLNSDPLARFATCTSCGVKNANEQYLTLIASKLDLSKFHNLMQVALASYRAGDHEKAITQFELALAEDAGQVEPWCFAAISAAESATQANLVARAAQSRSYIASARSAAGDQDTVETSEAIAEDKLAAVAIRAMDRAWRDARNDRFAYGSTDKAEASRRENDHLKRAISLGQFVIDSTTAVDRYRAQASACILESCRVIGNSDSEVARRAKGFLEQLATSNPILYAEFGGQRAPNVSQKSVEVEEISGVGLVATAATVPSILFACLVIAFGTWLILPLCFKLRDVEHVFLRILLGPAVLALGAYTLSAGGLSGSTGESFRASRKVALWGVLLIPALFISLLISVSTLKGYVSGGDSSALVLLVLGGAFCFSTALALSQIFDRRVRDALSVTNANTNAAALVFAILPMLLGWEANLHTGISGLFLALVLTLGFTALLLRVEGLLSIARLVSGGGIKPRKIF